MENELKQRIEGLLKNSDMSHESALEVLRAIVLEEDYRTGYFRESVNLHEELANRLELLKKGTPKVQDFTTGFPQFDEKFGGFNKGELIVLGGRPGMGKTRLLVHFAQVIGEKKKVVFYSLEQNLRQLVDRFICSLGGYRMYALSKSNISNEQAEELEKSLVGKVPGNVIINDSSVVSIGSLKAHIIDSIVKSGAELIILDYIQLIGGLRYRQNREIEMSMLCRELKNIARNYNVCIVIASQLSRGVEMRGGDKRPMLADLRDSGAIEQDADKVLLLYSAQYYGIDADEEGNSTDNINTIIIAKNRNGPIGDFNIEVEPGTGACIPKDDEFKNFNNDLRGLLGEDWAPF